MEFVLPLLVAFFGGGGLATWLTSFFIRKKTDAEATDIIVKSALSLLAEHRQEIVELRTRVDALEAEVESLRKENIDLRRHQ
jgi:hypothetical protein